MNNTDQQLLVEARLEGRWGEWLGAGPPYFARGPDDALVGCRNLADVLIVLRGGYEALLRHILDELESQL